MIFYIFLAFTSVKAEYRFDQWTTDKGLPQNAVRTIVGTRDGYLWMGTFEGLARFDGVNFTSFDLGNTKEFKTNYVRALLEDSKGNLWIGIDGGGLVRYSDKKFFHYSSAEDFNNNVVISLFEDSKGNLWIGSNKGNFSVLRNGVFSHYNSQDGLPGNEVLSFAEDDSGVVWLGTEKGLAFFKDNHIQLFNENNNLKNKYIRSLFFDRNKKLWIGTGSGLNLLENGKLTGFEAQDVLREKFIYSLAEDDNNNLWIGTDLNGLYRLDLKNPSAKAEPTIISGKRVPTLYKDSENQIWIGTFLDGLFRYSGKNITPLTSPDFQLENNATAVYEDKSGSLWFSIVQNIYRMKDGKIEIALPGKIPGFVSGIMEDKAGNMWFGGEGVYKYSNGDLKRFSTAEGLSNNIFYIMLNDHNNDVWVGTFDGLNLIHNGEIKVFKKEDGLPDNNILSLFEDKNQSIWIGTREGITRYKDGKFTNWTTDDGLANNRVSAFFEERDGTLWIATNGGLTRMKDGKFSVITAQNGLYDNLAHHFLEDDDGNLWMSSNKGIYRAALKELNDFADGKINSVKSYSYGKDDGMISRECNGASPGAWKTKDGKLWFSTIKGLVEINPEIIKGKPPNVIIEQALINDNVAQNNDFLEINSGSESLEIRYTAISWNRPSKIHFKYKLAGLDENWVDVGNRRTAYFSYLPPGEYTFTVIADNGDGIWNLEGKNLKIKVFPPFYRTWWFTSLAVLLAAGLIFALFKRRTTQLKKERIAQQAFSRQLITYQEQERKRIAAELHDSLGQRLVVIKNLALIFLNKDKAKENPQIEEISAEASNAIGEVKEISYNLRPYQIDRIGLTKAVEAIIRSAQTASEIDFSSEIDDIDNYFPKDLEINFYRIVQECVNNALKHSEATKAFVKIKRVENNLDFEISDNGKGFSPYKTESKSGGFGLLGINERTELFGGKVEIKSSDGQGTFIKIHLDNKYFPFKT